MVDSGITTYNFQNSPEVSEKMGLFRHFILFVTFEAS